jgi:hypothetical protein
MGDGGSICFLYEDTDAGELRLANCVVASPHYPDTSGYYRLTDASRAAEPSSSQAAPAPPIRQPEFRSWTDHNTGRTIEAVLEDVREGTVILRMRTGKGSVSMDRLSPEDQDYVRRWTATRQEQQTAAP